MAESVGMLRIVTPQEVTKSLQQAAIPAPTETEDVAFSSELARFVRHGFDWARQQRQQNGVEQKLLDALRVYQGQYSPTKLAQIREFQGSEVYSRITSVKCRGASALLRDIYFSGDTTWFLEPTPEPEVPGHIAAAVVALVKTEIDTLTQAGQQVDPQAAEDRTQALLAAARKAEKKQAKKEADNATSHLQDQLIEGKFYEALQQLILDLPIFPYACIKGPVVRMSSEIEWQPDGTATSKDEPKKFWERVSPFDLWFSPGASDLNKSTVYEHFRLTRAELFDLIGVEGYDEKAIRACLEETDSLHARLWSSYFESQRADLERREDPNFANENLFLDCMAFCGYVDGQLLIDWGLKKIKDPQRPYYATCWLVDKHIIKAQLNPSPRQRAPYYITSFEKIPGSITGNGLPEILSDIQDVVNATLRALVNNLSISSGPQVIVDDTRQAPGADSNSLYPWKRWHVISDPLNNAAKPVDFFQPNSNAQELLGVYKEFNNMADEISAIPRYLTGSQRTGGAASTASGLSMLMNNSSKVMQSVAANVDTDVITPVVENLYDLVMLTEPGKLRGDESIVVRGVTLAVQREQDRVRQLEFLNITSNPLDAQIVGPRGRASVLRAVAKNLGLEYDDVVADDDEVQKMIQAQQNAAANPEQGDQPAGPDAARNETGPPRMNTVSNASTT